MGAVVSVLLILNSLLDLALVAAPFVGHPLQKELLHVTLKGSTCCATAPVRSVCARTNRSHAVPSVPERPQPTSCWRASTATSSWCTPSSASPPAAMGAATRRCGAWPSRAT